MKNVKIQKRRVLNKLIQEIVDQQVEMMLLEYASGSEGALFSVFVQPFLDTANVIKGEIQKTGAKAIGATAEGLVRAFSVLLPFTKKVPFSGKTWDQAANAVQGKTKQIIGRINQKYAGSYNAVANAFRNPDLAFAAFAFNPALYLGTALATNSFGGALSAVESILGTSGNVTEKYNSALRNIGIFSPSFTPGGGGRDISGGIGYTDTGDMSGGGGINETISRNRMKNYISLLLEDAKVLNKVFEQAQAQAVQSGQQLTKQDYNQIYDFFNQIMNIVNTQIPGYYSNRTVRNEIYKNIINLYRQDPEKIKTAISSLANIKGTDIVDRAVLEKVNSTEEAQKIINNSINLIANELKKSFAQTPEIPKNLEDFINFIKENKDPKIQQIAKQQLDELKKNFSANKTEEEKNKINSAVTLEALYSNLNDAEKKMAQEQYVKASAAIIEDNKKTPEKIKAALETQFKETVDESTLNKLVAAIMAPQ